MGKEWRVYSSRRLLLHATRNRDTAPGSKLPGASIDAVRLGHVRYATVLLFADARAQNVALDAVKAAATQAANVGLLDRDGDGPNRALKHSLAETTRWSRQFRGLR
jgi:hypothetical protein